MIDLKKQYQEFDNHELVSFIQDNSCGLQAVIALHRGNSHTPTFGATRIVDYKSIDDALKDALRLSRAMSYKAALAGLRYGGGKGVIIAPRNVVDKKFFECYAEKINLFNGRFITGADVGVSGADVKTMSKYSSFMVGVNSDPVKYTALGLFYALDIALKEVFQNSALKKRKFAIQGVGKIGESFLNLIYKKAGKIYITDVDNERVKAVKRKYPKVEIVTPASIYRQSVDVFSPCALGNVLNSTSISKIKAPIILGGANDQLQDAAVGELLFKLGILYAPDYVVNAGGLIAVVDEYEHKKPNQQRITRRLNNIKVMLREIIKNSRSSGLATNIVADQMAEKIFNNH
jgi:leucine dehydrogenase